MNKILDLDLLIRLQQPPEPFAPGNTLFWDDPHISAQMLASHLDPSTDAASRSPAVIERTVPWLLEQLRLQPGADLLDLGCGPGLYAARFAACGLHVTGIDYSQRSIDYARHYAAENHLAITYRYQDYRTLADAACYDAAVLIYGDFCTFAPEQRVQLLHNIRRALRPHGRLALDVTTPAHRKQDGLRNAWYAAKQGFWRPGPHLVLEHGFDYSGDIYLDQYIVLESDGAPTVYRNWFQDFTAERISAELEANGFTIVGLWNDLSGTPFSENSAWIGVIAEKGAS